MCVLSRQLEHREIQRVESGERHKLELIAHLAQLALEVGNFGFRELRLPVERWRAIVSKQLARKLCVKRVGEAARFFHVRLGGFAPDQVGVWSVSKSARDCGIESAAHAVEAFYRARTSDELAIARIAVAGEQLCRIGVGARDYKRRHSKDVGC